MTSAIVPIDMRSSNEEQRHSIAWDPSNPSALLIVSNDIQNDPPANDNTEADINMESNNSIKFDHIQFHTLYAESGNVDGKLASYELKFLLRLISDYEMRIQEQQDQLSTHSNTSSYREQSQRYRNTVTELLLDIPNTNEEDPTSDQAKTLLTHINAILYLSETYLLPPPSSSTSSVYGSSNSRVLDEVEPEERSYYYSDGTMRNWFDCPGIATADTIRFLRQYELPLPTITQCDDDDDDMMENDEKEYLVNHSDFLNDEMYWKQLLLYCKCGYLHLVWRMIQTNPWYISAVNSLYQREENDDANKEMLQSFLNDWEQLGRVLLTAPIPGGRCVSATDNDGDDPLLSDHDIDLTYVDGLNVSRNDYQNWDIPTAYSSSIVDHAVTRGDRPMIYTPETAIQKHQYWSDYVKHVRANSRLCSTLKNVDLMLKLLSGDYGSMKRRPTANTNQDDPPLFSSWSEQLCCELLYRTPDLRPRSIASRTAIIMKRYRDDNTMMHPSEPVLSYEATIIAIMHGDAGRTITALYDLGGASGAAVPRTLMALVFELFVESKIIKQEWIEKRSEFLIEASSSIVASSRVSDPDIGVQLAIRLLLPHITMIASPLRGEFAAAISNILEHYTPTTEYYARTALSLCIPVISKTENQSKHIQWQWQRMLLDGCVSVLVQLYRKYELQRNHNQTVDVTVLLLDGVDLESDVLPQPWLGTCYRLLEAECFKTILTLLQAMASSSVTEDNDTEVEQHADPFVVARAEPMSKVIERYISSTTANTGGKSDARSAYQRNPADRLPAVALLLVNVVEMCTLFLSDTNHHELAKHITTFLSKCNSVLSSSSMCLRLWMLRVARSLIEREIDGIFNSSDVTILLQHLSAVKSFFEITASRDSDNAKYLGSVLEQDDMQSCFHGLLLQSMCSQNAMKQKNRANALQRLESSGHIDLTLDKSVHARKELVWNMLH